MGFSRQEYWSGLPFPSPGDVSPPRNWTRVSCIAGRWFTNWVMREALRILYWSTMHTNLAFRLFRGPDFTCTGHVYGIKKRNNNNNTSYIQVRTKCLSHLADWWDPNYKCQVTKKPQNVVTSSLVLGSLSCSGHRSIFKGKKGRWLPGSVKISLSSN